MKRNCWEVKHCGREPGGDRVHELGVCPVSEASQFNLVNQGTNAGRFCWAVAGTLCGGEVQGTFVSKVRNCMDCDFYRQVVQEEGNGHVILNPAQLN